jgi:hypothetical protein
MERRARRAHRAWQALMKQFGSFYRAFFAERGLLSLDGCADAGSVYIDSDTDHRTVDTSGMMLPPEARWSSNCGRDLGAKMPCRCTTRYRVQHRCTTQFPCRSRSRPQRPRFFYQGAVAQRKTLRVYGMTSNISQQQLSIDSS